MLGAIETGCRSNEENSILSDTELLARFKNQRDEPAFAQFVDRHAAMVLGICHRLLGTGRMPRMHFRRRSLSWRCACGVMSHLRSPQIGSMSWQDGPR